MAASKLRGFAQLFFGLFAIWFFVWQVTPVLVAHIPPLAKYGKAAEDNNVMPSALYYNDVPITVDAENHNRNTVRFLPRGPVAE